MIEIKNLYKIYNENKKNEFIALKNINLSIKEGEFTIIKGPSGSGKSTLLSIIASYQKPSSGEVIVQKDIISKLPDIYSSKYRLNKIGFVFQDSNFIENINLNDNLLAVLIPSKISFHEANKRIDKYLNMFQILDKKYDMVQNLSGGEKQRAQIVRALLNDANIILFDEPSSALDDKNRKNLINILKELKDMKKTIIISTHDSEMFDLDFVDKTIVFKNGEIIE